MKVFTIMLAGGAGTRMSASTIKTLLPLCGKSVLRRSVEAFSSLTDEMVVVCHSDHLQELKLETEKAQPGFPVHFAVGGATRQQSVLNGLHSLHFSEDDIVLIHDAARCLVPSHVIRSVVHSVREHGSGIPGLPVSSTYKSVNQQGIVTGTVDRSQLFEIQTPQGFPALKLLLISQKAAEDGYNGTDDASLFEHYGDPVRVVPGSAQNIKLTTPEDLVIAKAYLKGELRPMRVGFGYDVHRLVADRPLYLCGIEIPWSMGLLGHSDADVALHALMDAMLGASGLGDIGRLFPDTDDQYRGISSLLLLAETNRRISEAGFHVNNADITIVAQKPKLQPYIDRMVQKVAETLQIDSHAVNVKATTTEKLGFEGREEGISAYAVCTVE